MTATRAFLWLMTVLVSSAHGAQDFPPGYLDPEPVLRAAERAIGADRLRCVTIGGTAEAAIVVDPYAIKVTDEGGEIRPVRYRERIRAFGPPVHPEFAKQSVSPKGT